VIVPGATRLKAGREENMVTVPNIPNLRHLRMLQVIGRTQGIGSAAREMNTSQPAVTLAVATVESELGIEVFERGGSGTFPTSAGRLLLARVSRFFDILEAALQQVAGDAVPQRRPLPPVERVMTGTQMRALIALSDPRSVETVAEHLDVSVNALYRATRSLEKVLDADLFDRTVHGPACNPAGLRLARQFKCAADELKLAFEEIRLAEGTEETEIVIGALPMSGSYELAEAVYAFSARRRRARINIVTGEFDALLDDLSNCRLDMIFGLLRCPDWARDLTKEDLFSDSYCIVTRPGHPLARLRAITPQDLSKYDWIVPPDGTPRRRHIEQLFEGMELPHFNIETRSLATSRALLMKSNLITVMTRSEIQIDMELGMLRGLPCTGLKAIPPKGIATRMNWMPTPVHAEFLEVLRSVTADKRGRGAAGELLNRAQ
jgi:DNA-binding transcriptional LysR family regulator